MNPRHGQLSGPLALAGAAGAARAHRSASDSDSRSRGNHGTMLMPSGPRHAITLFDSKSPPGTDAKLKRLAGTHRSTPGPHPQLAEPPAVGARRRP